MNRLTEKELYEHIGELKKDKNLVYRIGDSSHIGEDGFFYNQSVMTFYYKDTLEFHSNYGLFGGKINLKNKI